MILPVSRTSNQKLCTRYLNFKIQEGQKNMSDKQNPTYGAETSFRVVFYNKDCLMIGSALTGQLMPYRTTFGSSRAANRIVFGQSTVRVRIHCVPYLLGLAGSPSHRGLEKALGLLRIFCATAYTLLKSLSMMSMVANKPAICYSTTKENRKWMVIDSLQELVEFNITCWMEDVTHWTPILVSNKVSQPKTWKAMQPLIPPSCCILTFEQGWRSGSDALRRWLAFLLIFERWIIDGWMRNGLSPHLLFVLD